MEHLWWITSPRKRHLFSKNKDIYLILRWGPWTISCALQSDAHLIACVTEIALFLLVLVFDNQFKEV